METHSEHSNNMENRIKNYWKQRSSHFEKTRENELHDTEIGKRWMSTFQKYFPNHKKELKILDVGTGAGYFAILLASYGHHTTGIDLTPEMIEAAKDLAAKQNSPATFQVMNALQLDFPDESFDAIVTRNLTWTLPDVPGAYKEWCRVLKPGGVLINFDANYGDNVRYEQTHPKVSSQNTPFSHQTLTDAMLKENSEITLSMEASQKVRPGWDLTLFPECGFFEFGADIHAGKKILQEWDQITSPLFVVWARKG